VPETAREFFEELPQKIDREATRGTHASYRFDVDGAGTWRVEIDDGTARVSESSDDADCVIAMSEKTFLKIVRGEQNPATAYMLGTVKAKGDTSLALRLRDFLTV